MRWPGYLVMDVVLVVAFALVGRGSHSEAFSIAGLLGTAAPFLAGLLAGWAYSAARGYRPLSVRQAVPMWLLTVAIGHIVRVAVGGTTHWSFILVSLVALGIFLLVPRAVLDRSPKA